MVRGYYHLGPSAPLRSYSEAFLEGSVVVPLSPLNASPGPGEDTEAPKKPKRGKQVRLLLDARTELTNEELEVRLLPVPDSRLLTVAS